MGQTSGYDERNLRRMLWPIRTCRRSASSTRYPRQASFRITSSSCDGRAYIHRVLFVDRRPNTLIRTRVMALDVPAAERDYREALAPRGQRGMRRLFAHYHAGPR